MFVNAYHNENDEKGWDNMSSNVCIRSLKQSDIEELNKIRRSKGVFETILSLQDETLCETKAYFLDNLDNAHTFIAESERIIVGYIKLVIDDEKRKKHKARISIAIHPDYQGNGIGSRLFKEIIDLAENWLMLRKLELTVLEKNQKGIDLYKKYGFEIEGVSREDTVVNGRYENVIHMGMLFSR